MSLSSFRHELRVPVKIKHAWVSYGGAIWADDRTLLPNDLLFTSLSRHFIPAFQALVVATSLPSSRSLSTGLSVSVTKRLLILSPSGAITELPWSPRPILPLLTFYHKPCVSLVIQPLGQEAESSAEDIHHNYKPFAQLANISCGLSVNLSQRSAQVDTRYSYYLYLHVLDHV